MNKPKIDWEYITRKCERKLSEKHPSIYVFGIEHRVRFMADLMQEAQKRHASGQAGHKIKKSKVHYNAPTDLCCDDPYYDGIPVIDL